MRSLFDVYTRGGNKLKIFILLLTFLLLLGILAVACSPTPTVAPTQEMEEVEPEEPTAAPTEEVATEEPMSGNPLFDMLPDDIKASGEIELITNPASGPPWTYHPNDDPNVYAGIAIDFANAVAERLGVSIEWNDGASISTIIPTIVADRYNLAVGGYFNRAEREDVLDQIVYAQDAATIVVAEGNPKQIKGLDDLCGLTVAVPVGTNQERIVEDQQELCSTPIVIQSFPAKSDTFLQVQSGRADATIDGYAVSHYLAANNVTGYEGMEPLLGVVLNPGGVTFMISENQTQLRDAIVIAFNDMIADGEYMQILEKWEIPDSAVDEVVVDPLTSGQ